MITRMNFKLFAALVMTGLLAAPVSGQTEDQEAMSVPDALNYTVKSITDEDVALSDYQGKVIVVVNVASRCGYTRQYADLQALYEAHKDEGLVVLGFPCNQFGGQEPGSDKEILEFCTSRFDVTFDMFSKVDVNGDNAAEFFQYLTSLDLKPGGDGDVKWNFEKFVIDRSGDVVGRFRTKTELNDDDFLAVVKKALADKE